MDSLLGKRVETAVWVCGERKAMYQGVVVEDDGSGVIKVDVCPTGAPWIHYENRSHVRVIDLYSQRRSECQTLADTFTNCRT